MKAPGTKCLKLRHDQLLSNFAFNVNLRRYSMAEIRGLHERLLGALENVEERFLLIPLHSTLSSEEQRLTFSYPPPGVRKVSNPKP